MMNAHETASGHWKNLRGKLNEATRLSKQINSRRPNPAQVEALGQGLQDAYSYRDQFLRELYNLGIHEPPFELLGESGIDARHMLARPFDALMFRHLDTFIQAARKKKKSSNIHDSRDRLAGHLRYLSRFTDGLSRLFSLKTARKNIQVHRVLRQVEQDRESVSRDEGSPRPQFNITPAKIRMHSGLLYWIVQELIGNAAKATKKTIQPLIDVENYSRKNEHVIEVRDNGVGITPELLSGEQNIFTGYSGFRSQHRLPGSGKLLPNIRRVIEAHGGKLEVESTEGQGATFRIILPSG